MLKDPRAKPAKLPSRSLVNYTTYAVSRGARPRPVSYQAQPSNFLPGFFEHTTYL